MNSKNFKLGLFVLISAIAFAFMAVSFSGIRYLFEKENTYEAVLNDVHGLSIGAEVRVNGVKAGRVKDIKFKDGGVLVVFSVKKDIPIYKDAEVSIGTLGLMGDKYVSVQEGHSIYGKLPPNSMIENIGVSSDTESLIKNLNDTAKNFSVVASNLASIISQNRDQIEGVIQNLDALTKNLNTMVVENRQTLKDTISNLDMLTYQLNLSLPQTIADIDRTAKNLEQITGQNKEDIRTLVMNLKSLSASLKEQTPILMANLNTLSQNLNTLVVSNQDSIHTSIENFAKLSKSLKQSSDNLNQILTKINSGQGTLGKLVNDKSLYANANNALSSFSGLGKVIKNSNLYIGGRFEYFRAGQTKGILSLKFQPNNESYYLFEIVGNSMGRVTTQYVNYQPQTIYEYKPEYTLQYARIFKDPFFRPNRSFFVIRGGLKESTGAVGLDYIYNNRLTFTSDLWNFGRKDYPNMPNLKPDLQFGATYQVFGPLFVRGGITDVLNSQLTGGFIGAGLVFTDNDLKYLLGAVKIP